MNNLDGMYYRNQAIINNQAQCSGYKTLKTYSACSEEQVKKTVVVEETKKIETPARPST